MNFKTGSFVKPTGVAPQTTEVNGLGFSPKAIILWTMGGTASGVLRNDHYSSIGFLAGPSATDPSGWKQRALAITSEHNKSPSDTYSTSPIYAISSVNGQGVTRHAGRGTIASDGFSLTWGVNNAVAEIIHWAAFGGSDLLAKVIHWNPEGSITGPRSVVGVGFRPEAVIHLCYLRENWEGGGGIGASDASGNQWAVGIHSIDNALPAASRVQQNTASMVIPKWDATIGFRATQRSIDPDGFTVDITNATDKKPRVATLCLGGSAFRVGTFAKSTAVAPATQTVTTGFRPKGALFASVSHPTLTTVQAGSFLSFGASDAVSHQGSGFSDADAVIPSDVDAVDYTNVAIPIFSGVGAIGSAGNLSAFNSDGFSLYLSPNHAVATQIGYIAFGDRGHPIQAQGGVVLGTSGKVVASGANVIATGRARLDSVALGLGPVHPISATGSVTLDTPLANFAAQHQITATGSATLGAVARSLRRTHPLTALLGAATLNTAANLRPGHAITATAIASLDTLVVPLKFGHSVIATGATTLNATARFFITLPLVRVAS